MKMSLQDALSSWLSIQLVADQRPDDEAAEETAAWFKEVLLEDHQVNELTYQLEKDMYVTSFVQDGVAKTKQFPPQFAESILSQIEENPDQYKIYK